MRLEYEPWPALRSQDCRYLAAFVRVAHFVGAIEAGAAVPEEGHAGSVAAIDYEKRKAGKRPLDNVDLPISQDRIPGSVPAVAERLPLPNGRS